MWVVLLFIHLCVGQYPGWVTAGGTTSWHNSVPFLSPQAQLQKIVIAPSTASTNNHYFSITPASECVFTLFQSQDFTPLVGVLDYSSLKLIANVSLPTQGVLCDLLVVPSTGLAIVTVHDLVPSIMLAIDCRGHVVWNLTLATSYLSCPVINPVSHAITAFSSLFLVQIDSGNGSLISNTSLGYLVSFDDAYIDHLSIDATGTYFAGLFFDSSVCGGTIQEGNVTWMDDTTSVQQTVSSLIWTQKNTSLFCGYGLDHQSSDSYSNYVFCLDASNGALQMQYQHPNANFSSRMPLQMYASSSSSSSSMLIAIGSVCSGPLLSGMFCGTDVATDTIVAMDVAQGSVLWTVSSQNDYAFLDGVKDRLVSSNTYVLNGISHTNVTSWDVNTGKAIHVSDALSSNVGSQWTVSSNGKESVGFTTSCSFLCVPMSIPISKLI